MEEKQHLKTFVFWGKSREKSIAEIARNEKQIIFQFRVGFSPPPSHQIINDGNDPFHKELICPYLPGDINETSAIFFSFHRQRSVHLKKCTDDPPMGVDRTTKKGKCARLQRGDEEVSECKIYKEMVEKDSQNNENVNEANIAHFTDYFHGEKNKPLCKEGENCQKYARFISKRIEYSQMDFRHSLLYE